ncbi:MAG TPA: molybdate ABC transporter substrate-binding protein [Terriglobales bacterium]|nr:molybdate ABC transporter substrate-binding protein [Terriglobales bacterium]
MKPGILVILIFAAALSPAQQLTVAAAADLQFAFHDLGAQFEKQTGISVRVTYGSSGNFTTQIENGAPFDLFFSADVQYPQRLVSEGFAEPGSLYRYANGKLVLWVPNGSKVDLSKGMAALLEPSVGRIALANPKHAPYGRAAVAAMKSTGVYETAESKLVLGENVSQTAQFVQSGTADVGLLALSLAVSPGMATSGHYVEVPEKDYPVIEQGAAIVKHSKNETAAKKFLQFMKTPAARTILQKYGFTVPKA